MAFQIVNADITTLAVDAIVNPSDWMYSGGGGTDLAIHTAAGKGLREECDRLPQLEVGSVEVTGAYALPSKHIIHTCGPIWIDGEHDEAVLLRSCYINAMFRAKQLGAESIAFPLISSGAFGFPKDQVLEIAIAAIRDFQQTMSGELDVTLCIFNRRAYELSRKYDLEQFLAQTAEKECAPASEAPRTSCPLPTSGRQKKLKNRVEEASAPEEMEMLCALATAPAATAELNLDDWLKKQDDTFAVTLLKLIDKKGMTDVECYKKAQVTKNTFWKINNNPTYRPSKQTVIAFAIALELTLEETEQFLKTVGFSLSHSNTFDMIIEYYISNGIYDLYEINAALYRYDQMCLGC